MMPYVFAAARVRFGSPAGCVRGGSRCSSASTAAVALLL